MYHAKMKLLRIFNQESQQLPRTCIITEHRIVEWLPYLLLLPSLSCQMFHGYIRLPQSVPRRPTLHSLTPHVRHVIATSHFSLLLSSSGSRLWAGEKGGVHIPRIALTFVWQSVLSSDFLWCPVNSFIIFLLRAFSSLCLREHKKELCGLQVVCTLE